MRAGQKNERFVRYTAAKLDEMIAHGEDRTDCARVAALTADEIEAAIDYEDEGVPDWSTVYVGIPASCSSRCTSTKAWPSDSKPDATTTGDG